MPSKAVFYRAMTKFLTFVVFLLLLIIITGTVIALLRRKSIEEERAIEKKPTPSVPQNASHFLRDGKAIYSDLGQLRALSSDSLPATIVLNPYLEYDAKNIPLQEELVKKKDLIRETILSWFAQRTWLSVETLGEADIKKELLKAVNNELSMGSSSSIYFAEFKVVH